MPSPRVLITVAAQSFALCAADLSVVRLSNLTRLPGVRGALHGLTTFEGATMPVLDVHGLLGLPSLARPDVAVVLRGPDILAAFAVDAVRPLSVEGVAAPTLNAVDLLHAAEASLLSDADEWTAEARCA